MATETAFAGYPSAVVYDAPAKSGSSRRKPLQQLLWGDFVRILDRNVAGDCHIRARNVEGWVDASDLQENRLLEAVFVDVGQGDGCLLVTPDDRHILIDAGADDHMARFLRWRYGGFRSEWSFSAGIISHSDLDHYGGFRSLLSEPNVKFDALYTNGIMERSETHDGPLGSRTSGTPSYLTDLVTTAGELDAFLSEPARWQGKVYPRMLHDARKQKKFSDFRMLGVSGKARSYLPGFEADKRVSIEVLAPILEPLSGGGRGLRWLGDDGKTKNGHSVVLRLQYGNISMLLGGDLNTPSEELMLGHYAGIAWPPDQQHFGSAIAAARSRLGVDIAKVCHHGSADFSEAFLEATHPLAAIISSGDEEGYAHPRADALGAIGRYGRGRRPLIFSTELSRSTSEVFSHPIALLARLAELQKIASEAPRDQREEARSAAEAMERRIERNVAVYGAINVRTDGRHAVIAYKIEKPRSPGKKWDIYCVESTATGTVYRGKE